MPVTIDATHAVQLPGADPLHKGRERLRAPRRRARSSRNCGSGFRRARRRIPEFHPDPANSTVLMCDGPSSALPLESAKDLLASLMAICAVVQR